MEKDSDGSSGASRASSSSASSSAYSAFSSFLPPDADPSKANAFRTYDNMLLWESIGFEIETEIEIIGDVHYQDEVYKSDSGSWQIKVDGVSDGKGVFEFVICHSTELGTLLAAAEEITTFLDRALESLRSGDTVTVNDLLSNLKGSKQMGKCLARIDPEKLGRATWGAFQMTVGIPLPCLAKALIAARDVRLEEWILQDFKATEYTKDWFEGILKTQLSLAPLVERNMGVVKRDELLKDLKKQLRDAGVTPRSTRPEDCEKANKMLFDLYRQPAAERLLASNADAGMQLVAAEETAIRWANGLGLRADIADSAAGLMALVLRYLNDGYKVIHPAQYAKSLFSVMARSNFHSMYSYLDEAARDAFTIEAVQECWGPVDDSRKKPFRVFRGGFTEPKIPRIFKHPDRVEGLHSENQKGKWVCFGPTIRNWIKSIKNPTALEADRFAEQQSELRGVNLSNCDLMSRGLVRYNSISMGSLNIRECGGVPFVVVEFREWPKTSLKPQYWTSLIRRGYAFYLEYCCAQRQYSDFPLPQGFRMEKVPAERPPESKELKDAKKQ